MWRALCVEEHPYPGAEESSKAMPMPVNREDDDACCEEAAAPSGLQGVRDEAMQNGIAGIPKRALSTI